MAAELRFVERADGPGGGDPVPPSQQEDDGEGARSSVRLVVVGNVVVIAEHVDEERDRTLLTPDQQRALADVATGPPQTLRLEGLGDFRVQAENAQGRFYVVGLSLDELNDTTGSLVLIFALVTAGQPWRSRPSPAPLVVRAGAASARAGRGDGDAGLGAAAREGRGRARRAGRRARTPTRAPRSARSARH